MRKRRISAAVFLSCVFGLMYLTCVVPRPLLAQGGTAATLTNKDVLKMVQAGLPESVVVAKIMSSKCEFDTSPDALIKLKSAGASASVLLAITEAGHSGTGQASPQPSAPSLPTAYGFYVTGREGLQSLTLVNVTTRMGLQLGGRGFAVDGVEGSPPLTIYDLTPTIIVYQQNINVATLHLSKLTYIRTMVANQFNLAQTKPAFFATMYGRGYYDTVPIGLWRPAGQIPVRIEPVMGQTGMYRLIPNTELQPGNYCLYEGDAIHDAGIIFTASSGRSGQAYYFAVQSSSSSRSVEVPAGVTPSGATTAAPRVSNPPSVPSAPLAPTCEGYQGCLEDGTRALNSRQWHQSLSYLQKASALDPTKPDAWGGIGLAELAVGRGTHLHSAWNKALAQGGTVEFEVWHYAGFHIERGTFRLTAKAVSYSHPNGKPVFAVPPSQLSSLQSHHPPLGGQAWSFGMKVQGHQYWFSFVPLGVQCRRPTRCSSPAGYTQEGVVSDYITQTIPKLALGTLAVAAPPPPSLPPAPAPTASRAESHNFAMLPSFSPDGSKVAFIQFHIEQLSYGPSNSDFRVCIADLKQRTLSCFPESFPTASGKVSVNPVRPVFTTDGKKVVFVAHTGEFSCTAVYISLLDASGLRRLSGCDSSPNGVSVSPDGLSFAFSSGIRLSMQKFSAGSATTVWTLPKGAGENSGEMNAGNYVFSPDSTRMVFSAYDSKALLYTRDLRAQTTSNLVSYGNQLNESGWVFPAFAANGRQVTFCAAAGRVIPSATGSAYYHEIFRVALNGGAPVRLTNDGRMDTEPRFADGGNRIIYASCGRQDVGLYSMGLNGQDNRLVTQLSLRACNPSGIPGSLRPPHFDVSPDGQTVVFEDFGSPPGLDLYIVGLQGKGRVRLMDLLKK